MEANRLRPNAEFSWEAAAEGSVPGRRRSKPTAASHAQATEGCGTGTDLSLSLKMTIWRKPKVIPDIWRPRRLTSFQ
jgi:hypothetical protein